MTRADKPFDAGDRVLEVLATEILRQQSGRTPQTSTAAGRRQAWNCARGIVKALRRSGLEITGRFDVPPHLTRLEREERAS